MKSKETLTRLTALAKQHLDDTQDDRPIQIVWSSEENAGDSGLSPSDTAYAGFVISTMQGLLSSREHADVAVWFSSHGFNA